MLQRLALFDLDNTLLAGDSDHAWGEFLISKNLVNQTVHREKNNQFYQDYLKGRLDIHDYVKFSLRPILSYTEEKRRLLHEEFMQKAVKPLLTDKAFELVAKHQKNGDYTLIITATNTFITAPIAKLFKVDQLLATDIEIIDNKLSGRIVGVPCYQEGKVLKLKRWLSDNTTGLSLDNCVFYTDSINDLPLLEQVSTPIAVNPDPQLLKISTENGWQIQNLHG